MSAPAIQQPLGVSVAKEQFWSVTTLTDTGLGKGEGLIKHGDRMIATASIEKRAIVDAILRDDGKDEAIKWLMDKRYTKSEKAKLRGTKVHAAAESIAVGATYEIEPEYEPYIEQYVRWLDTWHPRFLMAEAPVFNVTRRYGGTLDAIAEFDGHPLPVVVDYKTTDVHPDDEKSRPPYPEVALQLAAYSRAELVGGFADRHNEYGKRYYDFDPTAHHEPMPEIDLERGLCVVISPWDCFAVPVRIDDEVFETFLYAQACAYFKTEMRKTLFPGARLAAPRRAS